MEEFEMFIRENTWLKKEVLNLDSPILSLIGWGNGYVIAKICPVFSHSTVYVYGGLTYNELFNEKHLEIFNLDESYRDKIGTHVILGFDTAHYNSNSTQSIFWVFDETLRLKIQLEQLYNDYEEINRKS